MITLTIIAINIILSLICFKRRDLFYALSLSPYSISQKNEWYRVITHAFIHADTTHLIINMFVLFSFGTRVEQILSSVNPAINSGTGYYLGLYFGAIIFSSLYDIVKRKDNYGYNSVGASGAVMAVVFTSIFFSPWSKIFLFAIVPIPAILFGALYLWYELYSGRKGGGNVNHYAHIFGAIFGYLFPILIKPSLITLHFSQLLSIFYK